MTTRVWLHLTTDTRNSLWRHLLPDTDDDQEEAAFLYANWNELDDAGTFECIDWTPVPPDGFLSRSKYHLELTDAARASAIKKAHDLGACLVEVHSHTSLWPARFSPSDLAGFREFVPHVWWRLKGRPYLAVVVSRTSFDGLAWTAAPGSARRLDGIVADGVTLRPTGSPPHNEDDDDE